MKAQVLDQLLDDFAPSGGVSSGDVEYLVGRAETEVSKFFVAWNPSQLEGIVHKSKDGDGAYIAYFGNLEERVRCLLSLALGDLKGFLVRFVRPTWRYHSWGVSARIAKDIGISDPRPVLAAGRESSFKVVTFVPRQDLPRVRESVFSAGAGRYGLYAKCSFSSPGKGTFYGEKGAKPAYGEAGKLEEIEEERLEVVASMERLGKVMSILRKAHPYENPVIETYEIGSEYQFGEGRIGTLASPLNPDEASRKIASVLGSQPAYVSGPSKAREVVIWDGKPGHGLYEALLRKADLYVGPDSHGLAKLAAGAMRTGIVEFPRYCFLLMGAKELVYMVREKSKREAWGLRTFLPSKAGREGVHA